MCRACKAATCTECRKMLVKADFTKTQVAGPQGQRKCAECARKADGRNQRRTTGAPCCNSDCQEYVFEETWDQRTRHRKEVGETRALCPTCLGKGYTLEDWKEYECNCPGGCGRSLGRKHFNTKSMKNYKNRGGKLWCNDCITMEKEDAGGGKRRRKQRKS